MERRPLLIATGFVAAVFVGVGVQAGPLDVGALRVGESMSAEIVRTLGEPSGRGRLRTGSLQARDVWSYVDRRERQFRKRRDLDLLLVFLRDGRHDGHLWVESSAAFGFDP